MIRYLVAGVLVTFGAAAADAQNADRSGLPRPVRGVQTRSENVPFDELKQSVSNIVGGSFIGTNFDSMSNQYSMRFMRNGQVIDVVVDARTGKIIGRERF